MEMLYKLLDTESIKDADSKTRHITAVISSEAIDRDGEIVSASAMKKAMPAFMKNPVVLAAHTHKLSDGTSSVVGKVVKWWQEKDKTLAQIEFADTKLGMDYYILYSGGYQKAFSIGFQTNRRSIKIVGGKSVSVHDDIELFELSAVPVPSNQEALTKELQSQLTKSLQAIEKTITDQVSDIKKTYEERISKLESLIEERFEQVKDLLVNDPDGCGADELGDSQLPPVAVKKAGKIINAINNLLER